LEIRKNLDQQQLNINSEASLISDGSQRPRSIEVESMFGFSAISQLDAKSYQFHSRPAKNICLAEEEM
jgi:hypothetical protein